MVKKQGRKPVPEIKRVRRNAWLAWQQYRKSEAACRSWVAAGKPISKKEVGKPSLTPDVDKARAKIALDEARSVQVEVEYESGQKHLGEKGLAKWIQEIGDDGKPNDYVGGAGRPAIGTVGKLYKEQRRLQAQYDDAQSTPNEEYIEKIEAHEDSGKRGAKPLAKLEHLKRLKDKIQNLQDQIDVGRSEMSEVENLRLDLELVRIKRRNVVSELNKLAKTTATAKNGDRKREAYLNSNVPEAETIKSIMAECDAKIASIEARIHEIEPPPEKRSVGKLSMEEVYEQGHASSPMLERVKRRKEALSNTMDKERRLMLYRKLMNHEYLTKEESEDLAKLLA